MSWLSGWSDGAKKRICRFLIHRYLGHLLKDKLDLEQLSVDLHKEKAHGIINDVYMDSSTVNDLLEGAKVPVRLVDGYLGSISVSIPWSRLFQDSCCMTIDNLEITLTPESHALTPHNATDLMNSMLESVMCSMASSVELARSFLEEEGTPVSMQEQEGEEGVEAFATMIDALLLRMRLTFTNIIIRLEHFQPQATLGSALEIKIDKLDFIDEQLKASESCSTEPITTQPHSLYKVPDLNKIIEIQGIRMYTDVFSAPVSETPMGTMQSCYTSAIGMPQSPEGIVYTSMYLRRQKAKGKNRQSMPGSMINSTIDSSNMTFESCFGEDRGKSLPPPLQHDILGDALNGSRSPPVEDGVVPSNPIQFATLLGQKQVAQVRLKNMALSPLPSEMNTKIDLKLYLGSMACILSPSQLALITDILEVLLGNDDGGAAPHDDLGKGKPMREQDLIKIEQQLTRESMSPLPNNNLMQGNWAGENKFYPTSPKPQRDMQEIDVCSQGSPPAENIQIKMSKEKSPSSQKSPSSKREVSHIHVRLNSVFVTLTHKDPLGITQDITHAVDNLQQAADTFFQLCERLGISISSDLNQMQKQCDKAYPYDCLRLIGCPVVVDVTVESGAGEPTSHIVDVHCGAMQLVECLEEDSTAVSSHTSTTLSSHSMDSPTQMMHVPLLVFNEDNESTLNQPSFSLTLTNQPDSRNCCVSVELQPCKTQVDMTIVDRLYSLIYCSPPFRSPQPPIHVNQYHSTPLTPHFSANPNNMELFDNIFDANFGTPKGASIENGSSVSLSVRCIDWTVEVCVPVADLRPATSPGRPPWWRRRVQNESLLLSLSDVTLNCHQLSPESSSGGSAKLSCQKVIGYFSTTGTKSEEEKILYASSSQDLDAKHCSLVVKWDLQNRTLAVDELSPDSSSSWGSEFRMPKGMQGPFSQQHTVHQDYDQLTMAGSRIEMERFREKCTRFMQVNIHIDLPNLRLVIPDKDILGFLYNRLANDLALWEPSAPNPNCDPSVNLQSLHVAGLRNSAPFQMCRSAMQKDLDSDESDDESSMNKSQMISKKRLASKLGLTLNVDHGLVILGDTHTQEQPDIRGDMLINATAMQLFLVSGYEGDPHLAYLYVTATKATLAHRSRTCVTTPCYKMDVEKDEFGKFDHCDDVQIHPINVNMSASVVDDDNLGVALKILTTDEGGKSLTVAVAVRNSNMVYRPCGSKEELWLPQLIHHFDLVDLPVMGYSLPRTRTQLHVHLASCSLQYSTTNIEPCLCAIVWIESAHICTSIVFEASAFRLHIILEDIKLYLNQGGIVTNRLSKDFIVVLKCGLFQLTLTISEKPLVEMKANNDMIKMWLCADSLLAVIRLVESLQPAPENSVQCGQTHVDDGALKEMVESAMFSVGDLSPALLAPCSSLETKEVWLEDAAGDCNHNDEDIAVGSYDSNASNSYGRRVSSADEDFVIVDEIPGSGIGSKSGEPRIVKLSPGIIDIVDNHFSAPTTREDPLTSFPSQLPAPLCRYVIRELSLCCNFYGGSDFGHESSVKAYSKLTSANPAHVNSRALAARVDSDCAGGDNRDHTVLVQLHVTKASYVYEFFGADATSVVSRQMGMIQDVQVHDKLTASDINKLMYQHTSDGHPTPTTKPILSVRLIETTAAETQNPAVNQRQTEAKFKISMLPLRINIDQDTLEFVQDFGSEVAGNLVDRGEKSSVDDDPILRVPQSAIMDEIIDNDVMAESTMANSTSTLANLFIGDSPVQIEDGGSVRFSKVQQNDETVTENEGADDDISSVMQTTTNPMNLYFKTVIFSPSVVIRLDYQGKQRVNMDKGALQGLLMGLTALHSTELTLKQIHHRQGLLGGDRVIAHLIHEWVTDIQKRQIPGVIGSVGPMRSLTQVAQGLMDLVWLPVEEYRKDGHLVRGLHRGVSSFGTATATASIDFVHRFITTVQGVAEFALDVASPDYPPVRRRALTGARHPSDIREGIGMAYDAMADGLNETASILHQAAVEETAQGKWPVRGLLRQATPTALRPIVLASRAAAHVLGGVRSQLQPQSCKEEHDKWK